MPSQEVRSVLVSGAGGGIGRSVAVEFARDGAHIIALGRSREHLEQTSRLVENAGGSAHVALADVSNERDLRAVFDEIPRLDVAVNTAGIFATGLLHDIEDEDFARLFDTNVRGLWLCLREEIKTMLPHNAGSIINIGSNIGARSIRPGLGVYAATKAAVSSLTKTAAVENISHGIRVNCLCPGPVDTPMSYRPGEDRATRDQRISEANPSGRLATPEEIARTVVWLSSAQAAYIVGQEIVIDGGASV